MHTNHQSPSTRRGETDFLMEKRIKISIPHPGFVLSVSWKTFFATAYMKITTKSLCSRNRWSYSHNVFSLHRRAVNTQLGFVQLKLISYTCSEPALRQGCFQVRWAMGKVTKISWYCRLFQVLAFKAAVNCRHSSIVCWESPSIHQNTAGVPSEAGYLTFHPANKTLLVNSF